MNLLLKEKSEYNGVFRAANKNFGFVALSFDIDGVQIEKEVYVASSDSLNAMNNDEVLIKIIKAEKDNKKAEAKVLKIIKRDSNEIVGVFVKSKDFGFVVPTNRKTSFDVHIEKKYMGAAVNNSIVICKILNQKTKKGNPEGIIIKVLGHKNDPNTEILAILNDYKIRTEFDDKIIDEAKFVASDIQYNDLNERKDLRDKIFFTIDGEDAKDLDDAVCIEKNQNGNYILYVSIADVSHYVKEDSALDIEARKRGNSVYLIDRVVPMLPHILSNGVCSLNENEDRLTLTCEMEIDQNGDIVSSSVYESVINSKMRMSYNGVHAVLNNLELKNGEDIKKYEPFTDKLNEMLVLSNLIRHKRHDNGAIEFNFKESKIIVDENCKPLEIKEYERFESHKMIEDFMIAANVSVATEFFYREVPFLYRTHEPCDSEKMKELSYILSAFSLNLNIKNDLHPKKIQQLLESIVGKPYQFIVEKLVLRSMKQARYTTECLGHFALALKHYTHFTSPIRRYSDLQIHRIIKEVLSGKFNIDRSIHYNSILKNVAEKTSTCERVAIDCERDVDDMKKCEFMADKIGEVYKGIVSSVTNFGFYVALDNTIEGLVPIRTLPGYYVFNEKLLELKETGSNKIIKIGMEVYVVVSNVSKEQRIIDFNLVDNQ